MKQNLFPSETSLRLTYRTRKLNLFDPTDMICIFVLQYLLQCRSCFNVNVNFKIVFKTIVHLLVNKKIVDNIKMHGMIVKRNTLFTEF